MTRTTATTIRRRIGTLAVVVLLASLSVGRSEVEESQARKVEEDSKSQSVAQVNGQRVTDNGQAPRENGQPAAEPGEAERQRALTTAILMLGGVLFIGAMTIVLILLWGFRVRRIARRPLPRTTPVDPLWYLRGRQDRPLGARSRTESASRGELPGAGPQEERPEDEEPTDPGKA